MSGAKSSPCRSFFSQSVAHCIEKFSSSNQSNRTQLTKFLSQENEDKKFAFKKRDLARVLKFIIDNCAKDNNVKGQYNFDDGWNVQLVGVPPNM